MFRLSFFVEDKNLPKVLIAVQGLALNMEAPQPVVNATVVKGKVKAVKEGGYSLINEVTAILVKYKKGTGFNSALLKDIIARAGGQPGSFGYISNQLRKNKIIKLGKPKGQYIILQGKD